MIKEENMTRNEIKELVYECAKNKFYDKERFNTYITSKPNDGEDELIYSEIGFDSLDMVEFLMDIERRIGNHFIIEDSFIDSKITLGKVIDYIYDRLNK